MTDRVRAELLAQARDAHAEYERAKKHFATPYSGHEAAGAMHRAGGYWQGLWRAIEVMDSLSCGFCGQAPEDHSDSNAGPMSVCPS